MPVDYTITHTPQGRITIRCNNCAATTTVARTTWADTWKRNHLCIQRAPLTYTQRIRQEHTP